MPPPDPTLLDSPAPRALSPEDRALLTLLLTGPGSLRAVAEETGLDILTLAERILAPEIQAALEAIKEAATQLSHVRALIGRPVALATLEAVSTEINPSPIERRRAASALLRAAPTAYPNAPRRASSTRSTPHAAHSHPASAPASEHTQIKHPAPAPEAAQQLDPAPELREPDTHTPSPASSATTHEQVRAVPHPKLQSSPNLPKPTPKSRDRPRTPPIPFIPLARKPPLIAAA